MKSLTFFLTLTANSKISRQRVREDTKRQIYDEALDRIVVDISGKGGVSYRQLSYNETGDNVYDVYFKADIGVTPT